ncbi:MAG: hypothetical protein VX777_09170 [Chlamydiota bacterium]|nr:hypothetical protein [Chlamydiota bacterium]
MTNEVSAIPNQDMVQLRQPTYNRDASLRTALGIKLVHQNSQLFMISATVAALIPEEWAQFIENYSDEQIANAFDKMPDLLKKNIKELYKGHTLYNLAGAEIFLITSTINRGEQILTAKLAFQAINRSMRLSKKTEENSDNISNENKAVRTFGDRITAAANTIALGRMSSKTINTYAASAGAGLAAVFPKKAEPINDKIQSMINTAYEKMPAIVSSSLPWLYLTHEVALEVGCPIGYGISTSIKGLELGVSAYFGMQIMMRNRKR